MYRAVRYHDVCILQTIWGKHVSACHCGHIADQRGREREREREREGVGEGVGEGRQAQCTVSKGCV